MKLQYDLNQLDDLRSLQLRPLRVSTVSVFVFNLVVICPAYSRILLLERAAHSNTDHEIREQKLVHARVLGYLSSKGLRCRRANP